MVGWVGWVSGGDAERSNCVKSLGDIRQPVEQSGNLWHSLLKSMMTSLTPPSSNTKLNCCIMSQQEESLQADKWKDDAPSQIGSSDNTTPHICMYTIFTMQVSHLITSLMFHAWIVLAGAWFVKSPSQSQIVFLRGRKAPSYQFSTEKVKMLKEELTKVMITIWCDYSLIWL